MRRWFEVKGGWFPLKAEIVWDGCLEEVLPRSEKEGLDSQREVLPSWFSILGWKGTVFRTAW